MAHGIHCGYQSDLIVHHVRGDYGFHVRYVRPALGVQCVRELRAPSQLLLRHLHQQFHQVLRHRQLHDGDGDGDGLRLLRHQRSSQSSILRHHLLHLVYLRHQRWAYGVLVHHGGGGGCDHHVNLHHQMLQRSRMRHHFQERS